MQLGIGSRVRNEDFGVGVVIQSTKSQLIITFVNHGVMEFAHEEADANLEVLEAVDTPKDLVPLSQIEEALSRVLRPVLDEVDLMEMGEKWDDGKLILQPGNPELKTYELPIDTFFHKIVMVRDRLRVMEQRINSSNLTDEEKVNLQQYITRIYGSLTSFNVLFSDRDDGFIGTGK